MIEKVIFGAIALELAVVAYWDLKTQRISNRWSALNLILAVICYIALRAIYPFELEIFLFPLLTIFLGFFLYLANIMGAGDSKFLASLFFLMPPENHVLYFDSLLSSTIVVGSLMLLYRLAHSYTELKNHVLLRNWKAILQAIRSSFSYAPVMFLAWLLMGMKLWL